MRDAYDTTIRLRGQVANEVEEQLAAGSSERQIAELVQDHQVQAAELCGPASSLATADLFLKKVHEINSVEVAAAGPAELQRRLSR